MYFIIVYWESVNLKVWRGKENVKPIAGIREYNKDHIFVKEETMPDGKVKLILKEKEIKKIIQKEK